MLSACWVMGKRGIVYRRDEAGRRISDTDLELHGVCGRVGPLNRGRSCSVEKLHFHG